jgi:predicted transcriptional regulator
MAYDLNKLIVTIESMVVANVGKSLAEIADELAIDRHTIERAIRHLRGTTFRCPASAEIGVSCH